MHDASAKFSLLYDQRLFGYSSTTMKVEEAYPLFLAHGRAERQYAPETMLKLKDCFCAWILPRLGSKDLEGLARYDVLVFRSALVDAKLGINRQYT